MQVRQALTGNGEIVTKIDWNCVMVGNRSNRFLFEGIGLIMGELVSSNFHPLSFIFFFFFLTSTITACQ